MLDMPQLPPPAYEQVLTEKLLHCDLRSGGFTVKYEDLLQSVEIVVEKETSVSTENFDCIRQAADYEIVTFKDSEVQKAYDARVFEAMRPKMLAEARDELEKRGVLKGFPERSKFASDKLFAEALERQCGMRPGSFFVPNKWGLSAQPKLGRRINADMDRMSCLMAAITFVQAKGEPFEFGFIGNEAHAPKSR